MTTIYIIIAVCYLALSLGITLGYLHSRKHITRNIGRIVLGFILAPLTILTALGIMIHEYLDNHTI